MFMSTTRQAAARAVQHFSRKQVAAGLLLAALGWVTAVTAQAQTAPSSAEKYTQVTRACTTDYARFCKSTSGLPASGRDQAICLKYHKQDISLRCRTAVAAVSQ